MPSCTGTMQDFTDSPSAITEHWAHWPLAQKMPWGAPSLGWCPNTRMPLAKRAEAMVSPSRAWRASPFQVKLTVVSAGTDRMGCSLIR